MGIHTPPSAPHAMMTSRSVTVVTMDNPHPHPQNGEHEGVAVVRLPRCVEPVPEVHHGYSLAPQRHS